MNKILLNIALFILATAVFHPAQATEPEPGDSCVGFTENSVMRSGGPELGGAYHTLKCVSGIWEAIDGGGGGGGADDTTPDAFSFTDVTDAAVSTVIASLPVTVSGITAAVTAETTTAGASISVNSGAWVGSGTVTVNNGDTVRVRLTSASTNSTERTATVIIGGVSDVWNVTTVTAPDTTPDAFSFTDQPDAALNTQITSNTITIDGINASTSVSVSGTGSPQVSINGGAWTTNGLITNGQTLQVRLTTANTPGVARTATVTVGGTVNDVWSVTTALGYRLVFVTSTTYNGNLGGVSGADAKCNTRATAGGWPGTYKAWIATSASDDPISRFTQYSGIYVLPNERIVANSWADLVDGILENAISITELGSTVTGPVWTNVRPEGNVENTSADCGDWTSSSSGSGNTGYTTLIDGEWTDDALSTCSTLRRLYCFQQ